MGKIFIESKDIFSSILLFEHLYLVYQNDNGQEFVIRGGPETDNPSDFGSVIMELSLPIEQSEDARVDEDGNPLSPSDRNSRELDLANRSAEDVWNIMTQQATQIQNAALDYEVLSLNSNSVISSVLESVGFNPFFNLPIGKGTSNFPGVDNFLSLDSQLSGTPSGDILDGGLGNDTIIFSGAFGNDSVTGGEVLVVDNDTLSGTATDDDNDGLYTMNGFDITEEENGVLIKKGSNSILLTDWEEDGDYGIELKSREDRQREDATDSNGNPLYEEVEVPVVAFIAMQNMIDAHVQAATIGFAA